MKISIAMATYNGAKYLKDQLESFLHQTRLPDELVVCDDGSTDATLNILEEFRESAPFEVRVYKNEENLGYTKNFERALGLCGGSVIFLSDQDDAWLPQKVKVMTTFLANQPTCQVLQADMILADENLKPTRFTQLNQMRALGVSIDRFVTGAGTAVRREFLDLALPIPQGVVGHDGWIHVLSLALGARTVHPYPLQFYRRHSGNFTQALASQPRRLNRLTGVSVYGLNDATHSWRHETDRYRACLHTILSSTTVLKDLGLEDRAPGAVQMLREWISTGEDRIHIASLPLWRRWPRVLNFWWRGGYANSAGWKSAAKDLLRPRAGALRR